MKTFAIALATTVGVLFGSSVLTDIWYEDAETSCAGMGGRLIVSLTGTAYCLNRNVLIQPEG